MECKLLYNLTNMDDRGSHIYKDETLCGREHLALDAHTQVSFQASGFSHQFQQEPRAKDDQWAMLTSS